MVDLFAALRGMFRPLLTSSDAVSLILEEPHEVPRIYTDHKKISQVLRNYISNALKFTQHGEVRVAARREGDMVAFAVSDTGIGIAREHLGAVFNDFVQIDSPLQRKWRGTGLGLSLSKKIAELLGGSVGVESEPGVGSTFTLTVPIRYSGDGPASTPTSADRRPESAAHVE
jgi:signal transduction histidine kinase